MSLSISTPLAELDFSDTIPISYGFESAELNGSNDFTKLSWTGVTLAAPSFVSALLEAM
jgi:hypothetical protein